MKVGAGLGRRYTTREMFEIVEHSSARVCVCVWADGRGAWPAGMGVNLSPNCHINTWSRVTSRGDESFMYLVVYTNTIALQCYWVQTLLSHFIKLLQRLINFSLFRKLRSLTEFATVLYYLQFSFVTFRYLLNRSDYSYSLLGCSCCWIVLWESCCIWWHAKKHFFRYTWWFLTARRS